VQVGSILLTGSAQTYDAIVWGKDKSKVCQAAQLHLLPTVYSAPASNSFFCDASCPPLTLQHMSRKGSCR
jgi:hypothetical protein